MKIYSLEEIASQVQGQIIGDCTEMLTGPERIQMAQMGQITMVTNARFAKLWTSSQASVGIIPKRLDIQAGKNRALITVENVELAMIRILEMYDPGLPYQGERIHPKSIIESTAEIDPSAIIGAGAYIGPNVKIGRRTRILPNVTIMDEVVIGDDTLIWPGAVIRERSVIGNHCIIHNNASIGADGFGYIPSNQGLKKVPHIGNVVLGHWVEIGANACIDRGKFSSTVLGNGCKIDNLVQIGHNCVLGEYCIMAGNSGLAGSVTLGDGVMIGGSASIKDNTHIGSGARIAAGSGVIGDVEAGKVMMGYPAQESRSMLRQWAILKKMANGD